MKFKWYYWSTQIIISLIVVTNYCSQSTMEKPIRYISILRGINVGGKRKILMADLKELYEDLGFNNITTYIQSGNVIFDYTNTSNNDIAEKIQTAIKNKYDFDVPCIVRTKTEWEQSVKMNPFVQENEIESLHLTFLKDIPEKDKLESIQKLDFSPEAFEVINNDAFILCPGKYHKTKLSNNFFESKLKVQATTRNWKTVLKLLEISKV